MNKCSKNKTVTIIDYGAGNVKSIINIVEKFGYLPILTNKSEEITSAEAIIFPGQGHFGQAMNNLKNLNLVQPIKSAINDGKKFLGICLGLQVLFEESEEAPSVCGLGIFKGCVRKFKHGQIPQIGWNKIKTTNKNTYLKDDFYYFVNSYYVVPENQDIVASTAEYHIDFCSSVQLNNVTATQFHPEKSANAGLRFFENWLDN